MMSTLSLSASKGYVARVEATPAAAPAQVDSGTWRGSLSSPGICRSPGCPRRFSFAFTFSYVASCGGGGTARLLPRGGGMDHEQEPVDSKESLSELPFRTSIRRYKHEHSKQLSH